MANGRTLIKRIQNHALDPALKSLYGDRVEDARLRYVKAEIGRAHV